MAKSKKKALKSIQPTELIQIGQTMRLLAEAGAGSGPIVKQYFATRFIEQGKKLSNLLGKKQTPIVSKILNKINDVEFKKMASKLSGK